MYFLMDPTLHKILLERRSCDKTVAGVLDFSNYGDLEKTRASNLPATQDKYN